MMLTGVREAHAPSTPASLGATRRKAMNISSERSARRVIERTGRGVELAVPDKCREIVGEEIANLAELDICGWIFCQYLRIERVVALFGKHGRYALAPNFLHCRQDAQFIVDHDIAIGRVKALHIVKLFLFVDIDEDTVLESVPQAGSLHLARLEHR